jgi:hypothetical protein
MRDDVDTSANYTRATAYYYSRNTIAALFGFRAPHKCV